jgi:glyoxylase-like metal-dependent hydrolase (beta-lactamase superfamily II)
MRIPVSSVSKKETYPGVERLLGSAAFRGAPIFWTSCYRILGEAGQGKGDLLVDALAPRFGEGILGALERPPAMVLLTHGHEDHVGGAPALARRGVPILAPSASKARLVAPPRSLPLYRGLTWGVPAEVPEVREAPPLVRTDAGSLEAIPAPGHSPDQVAWFLRDRGWLFAGDAWFSRRRTAHREESIPAVIATLRRLSDLSAETLFPAHGPVMRHANEALAAAADELESLGRRARGLRDRGRSVASIRRELLGPEPALRFASFHEFGSDLLIRGLLEGDAGPVAPDGAATAP